MALADLSQVQQKVIEEAMRKLHAAGCKFAVMLPGGDLLGELEVVIKKPGTGRHKLNNFKANGYMTRVDKMKVGDVEVFDTSEIPAEYIRNYRSAICARAIRMFGNGNANTAVTGFGVELMRTG